MIEVTYGLKGSDVFISVGEEILLRVVDGHASVDTVRQSRVLHNGHAVVRAVTMLEEHDGSPVVGEVFGEGACGATSPVCDVTIFVLHSSVEGIATDDLMEMTGGNGTGRDERVDSLDAHGGAAEAKRGFNGSEENKSESQKLHVEDMIKGGP